MDPFELREKNFLSEGKVNALGEKMWKSHGNIYKCADLVKQKVFSKAKPNEDENFYYGRGFAAVMKSPKGAPFSTKGCYMIESVSDAARMLVPNLRKITNNPRPKRP